MTNIMNSKLGIRVFGNEMPWSYQMGQRHFQNPKSKFRVPYPRHRSFL